MYFDRSLIKAITHLQTRLNGGGGGGFRLGYKLSCKGVAHKQTVSDLIQQMSRVYI